MFKWLAVVCVLVVMGFLVAEAYLVQNTSSELWLGESGSLGKARSCLDCPEYGLVYSYECAGTWRDDELNPGKICCYEDTGVSVSCVLAACVVDE